MEELSATLRDCSTGILVPCRGSKVADTMFQYCANRWDAEN